MLQGCFQHVVTALCCQLCNNLCRNRSVSELLGQPCDKSDIPVKLVTSCEQVVQ